mmetsp:Transcript_22694/g.26173  ORF Transcript_22694/g.26173 Transcript_22694/m.26173 type:complete len:153 (+) Transcript_22694:116-574(+)|eukprot:CAMPEP_0194369432 /NCGR_PEP_ID=MMETSP0174-20130528/17734_1 /TAXON_ID=216777 /ORGANISM="Proboscia alata, Strain PI-D3" /LENGTH=152 /DNA_ID=CAMNT_0039146367 /DNA_START=94 /DNA_END=552 /DNA_ORIENTATION=-
MRSLLRITTINVITLVSAIMLTSFIAFSVEVSAFQPTLLTQQAVNRSFVVNRGWGRIAEQRKPLFMFDKEGVQYTKKDKKPDEEDENEDPSEFEFVNLGAGGEMQKTGWNDPDMIANTNPFEISWYTWIIILIPATLLADDVFHFLPDNMKF